MQKYKHKVHIKAVKGNGTNMKKWMIAFSLSIASLMASEVPSANMQERNEIWMKRKAVEQESYVQRAQSFKESQRPKQDALKQERMEMRKKVYPRGMIETH